MAALLSLRLGEGGAGLSTGQQQQLCLARLLMRRPRIVVLDEATAHVDAGAAVAMHTLVAEKFADRTVLSIAVCPPARFLWPSITSFAAVPVILWSMPHSSYGGPYSSASPNLRMPQFATSARTVPVAAVASRTRTVPRSKCTTCTQHRLDGVLKHTDRVVVMDAGRVVEEGRPPELLSRPVSAFAELYRAAHRETEG